MTQEQKKRRKKLEQWGFTLEGPFDTTVNVAYHGKNSRGAAISMRKEWYKGDYKIISRTKLSR